MTEKQQEVLDKIASAQKLLIGIGGEWRLEAGHLQDAGSSRLKEAYDRLYELIKDKDYYVVTSLTDGALYETAFSPDRFVAPCGNIHWRQCSKACTKDIWEEGEVPGDICPHCGEPLTGNTIEADTYIEEGYLPRWQAYMKWQTGTLNRELTVLELGEGFKTPTVMRWPFEKIVYLNKKAKLFRINQRFYQVPGEVEEKCVSIAENSVDFIRFL